MRLLVFKYVLLLALLEAFKLIPKHSQLIGLGQINLFIIQKKNLEN